MIFYICEVSFTNEVTIPEFIIDEVDVHYYTYYGLDDFVIKTKVYEHDYFNFEFYDFVEGYYIEGAYYDSDYQQPFTYEVVRDVLYFNYEKILTLEGTINDVLNSGNLLFVDEYHDLSYIVLEGTIEVYEGSVLILVFDGCSWYEINYGNRYLAFKDYYDIRTLLQTIDLSLFYNSFGLYEYYDYDNEIGIYIRHKKDFVINFNNTRFSLKKWDIDFDVADLSVYPLIENKLVSIEKEYYSFYREIRELYYEYYYVTFSSGIIQLYTGVELLSIFSGNFEFLDDRVYLKVNEESYLIENLKFIDKSLGKIVIIEGDEDFYFYDELETLPLPELEDIYLIFKYYESNYGEVKTLEDLKIPNYVSSVYLYPIYDIIGLEEIKEIALTKYFKMFDYFGYEVYFDFIDNKIISQNFLIEFINEEVKINFDDGLEVILPNDNNIKYEFLSDILYNELNYFFSGYIGEYITLYKILNGDLIYDEFNDYNYRKQYLFDDEYLEITEWGIEYLFFDLEIVDDYDVLFYYGSQESNALFNFYTNYDDDITFNIYKYSYISPDLFVNLYKDKAFKGVYLDEDYLEEYDFDDYSIKTFYLLYEELKAPEEIISDLLNKKMLTLFCNYYLTYKYFDDHIEVYKYDELIGYDDFLTETNYFKLGDVWFKNEEELTNFRMLLTNLTNEDFINKGSYYLYQSDEYEIYLYADFFEIYDYDSYDNYDYSLEVFEPTTIDLEELNAVVMPTGKGKAIVIDEDYERFYIIEDLMELPTTEPYNDFVYFTHYYYNNYGIDIYTLEDLLDIKTNETIIYLTSEYYQKELSHLINYVKDYKYIKFEYDILAYYELETNIIYGENFEIEIRNNSIKVSLDGHSPFVVEDTKSKTYVEIDKEIDEKLDIYFYLNDILLFVDIINEEVELDDSYYLSYIFKNFYDENNYNYSAIMYHHELLHFEYFAIEFLNSYSFD